MAGLSRKIFIYVVLIVLYVFSTNAFSHLKNLRGTQLRVVTAEFPPTIIIFRNSSGHIIGFEGALYQQILYLSEALGFTFEIFQAAENTNGIKLQNGSWNGNIGTLVRREADIALGPFAATLERNEAINLCGFHGGDDTGMLVKYPQSSVSRSSATDVFSLQVWIGFLVSAILIVVLAVVMMQFKRRVLNVTKNIMTTDDLVFFIFGTITSQGNYFRTGHKSIGALAVVWCFAVFVFVNTYNCTLTSYMSITYQRPEINSFQELATSSIYKAAILEGSIQDIDILAADKGPIKTIGDKLRKCSGCRMRNIDGIVRKVLNEDNFVAIQSSSTARGFMQKYSSKRNNCTLTLAQEKLVWKPMFLGVPKSSPLVEDMSVESMWWLAVGLQNYWFVKREVFPKHCQLVYNNKGTSTKRSSNRLKLEQFYIPFIVLFTGYFLALIIFLFEKICCCRSDH